LVLYAEGQCYADGQPVSAKEGLCRRATPTAGLGVSYAESISLYADGRKPSAYEQIPVVRLDKAIRNIRDCSSN
jgi:hypothetical protein